MLMLESLPADVLALVVGILGLVVGSFLNVVIHRVPIMMEREFHHACRMEYADEFRTPVPSEPPAPYNLWQPRSACPKCERPIRALENIPIVSWLLQRGRCRGCAGRISVRYPLVEAISGVLAAWLALQLGATPALAGMLVLTWALIALTMIDLDHQLLPDSITLPVLWLGLVMNLGGTFTTLESAVLGAVFGYLSLFSVYWAFRLATGKEGMGFGDFKLLALIGAFGGWTVLLPTILISSLVGAMVGLGLIATGVISREKPIPFGPYLAVAGWISLMYGDRLTALWLG